MAGSLAAAAIGGGLSFLSSRQQSKAAGQAAETNAAFMGEALDLQREQFNYLKGVQQPYVDFGTSALGAYANKLGFTQNAPTTTAPAMTSGPRRAGDVPSSGNNFFGHGSLEAAQAAGFGGAGGGSGGGGGLILPEDGAAYEAALRSGAPSFRMVGGPNNDQFIRAFRAPASSGGGSQQDAGGGAAGAGQAGGGGFTYDPALDTSRLPEFQPGEEFTNALTISRSDLEADPSYQFRRDEALDAIGSTQRARGMSLSGNALRDLGEYASNLASTEYGNVYNRAASDRTFRYGTALDAYNSKVGSQTDYLNRFASAAGLGQTAATNIGQAGQNYANAASNILAQTGNSSANAALAQGAIGSNALAGFGNALGQQFGSGGFNNLLSGLNFGGTSSFNGTGTGFAPVNWLS